LFDFNLWRNWNVRRQVLFAAIQVRSHFEFKFKSDSTYLGWRLHDFLLSQQQVLVFLPLAQCHHSSLHYQQQWQEAYLRLAPRLPFYQQSEVIKNKLEQRTRKLMKLLPKEVPWADSGSEVQDFFGLFGREVLPSRQSSCPHQEGFQKEQLAQPPHSLCQYEPATMAGMRICEKPYHSQATRIRFMQQ
jgi:hypothetical protein